MIGRPTSLYLRFLLLLPQLYTQSSQQICHRNEPEKVRRKRNRGKDISTCVCGHPTHNSTLSYLTGGTQWSHAVDMSEVLRPPHASMYVEDMYIRTLSPDIRDVLFPGAYHAPSSSSFESPV